MTAPAVLAPNSPRRSSNAKVVGWHYDYQLKLGAIANGATTPDIELQIKPGAPFALRGIGGYNVPAPGGGGAIAVAELAGAFIQYTDASDNWLQTALVGTGNSTIAAGNFVADWPTGGQNALYEPVYNQLMYQPGAVITVRVTNASGADWADPRIVFRGTKFFYQDLIYSPCYPKCYTAIPFQVPLTWGTATDLIRIAAGATVRNIPLLVTGADFVLRGGMLTIDTSVASAIGDLELLIRTQDDKNYANDFIHWQWLLSGLAHRPGVFYPEIYLPKDRMLLVDAKQGEALAASFSLVFTGERIWPK
jgi:hypothetical protein